MAGMLRLGHLDLHAVLDENVQHLPQRSRTAAARHGIENDQHLAFLDLLQQTLYYALFP
jgi:hypothetical protein